VTSNIGRLEARAGEAASGRARIEESLTMFREINSPIAVAETEARIAECLVLEGDFAKAKLDCTTLLQSVNGKPGFEQVQVSALRLLATAFLFGDPSAASKEDVCDARASLDEAIARAESLEATYELAIALATRSTVGGSSSDEVRAADLFDQLGVEEAVVTWGAHSGGEAVYTRTRTSG